MGLRFLRVAAGEDEALFPDDAELLPKQDTLLPDELISQELHKLGHNASDEIGRKPLPQGWEKHYDVRHREWYYWHRPTNRSVWERPEDDDTCIVEDCDVEEDEWQ